MRRGATLALVPLFLGVALAPASALAGDWSLPDEAQGHRVAPLLLLSRADVRDDLQLPGPMAAEVARGIDDLQRQAAALKGRTDAAAVERRRAVDEGQRLWLGSHLTPEQLERLAQLDLRWEGPAAIVGRPAIAEALSLSDDQRAALARAVDDRNAHRDQGKDAERRLADRVLATLDDGQKRRWERMLGRPFTPRVTAPTGHRPGP